MITQLRPFYTADEIDKMYNKPYNHAQWEDRKRRVLATIDLGKWLCNYMEIRIAADLSCGDGAILRGLEIPFPLYGDLVAAPHINMVGPIEHTVEVIDEVDLFVLTETLEHLQDPEAILQKIRARTTTLLFSTPVGEQGVGNPEHYWSWEVNDVESMLEQCEFNILQCTILDTGLPGGYVHGIWACA